MIVFINYFKISLNYLTFTFSNNKMLQAMKLTKRIISQKEFCRLVYPFKNTYFSTLLHLRSTIRLIDELGKSTLVSKKEAEKVAHDRKMDLKQVGFTSDKLTHAVYKLVSAEPQVVLQSPLLSGVKTKELTLTCLIEDHDLKVKSKKLQEFLNKGYQVSVTVSKPLKTTLLPKVVFDRLISFLDCSVEISSTKANENMFKTTVAKGEKTS